MNSLLPHTTEPMGTLRPLDRQKLTLSASLTSSAAGVSRLTAALKMRAPSTCSGISWRWATSAMARVSSGVSGEPPQALWVFSSPIMAVRGKWTLLGRIAASTTSGSIMPRSSFGTTW